MVAVSAPSSIIGQTLGHYRILEEIGEGGTAPLTAPRT
jgi:hypothetical protein